MNYNKCDNIEFKVDMRIQLCYSIKKKDSKLEFRVKLALINLNLVSKNQCQSGKNN